MSGKPNVVIFGESGSGKSSTANLLLGREVANVSDKAVGCTFEFKKYETAEYHLFDTVGLSEGKQGTMSQSAAMGELIRLLKSLEEGVSLLVLVIEKGRIKDSLDKNYKLFVNAICMSKVPVLLLITHCETDTDPDAWFKENKESFDKYGMTFKAVISGCCKNPNDAPPLMQTMIQTLNEKTVAQLQKEIKGNMLIPGWMVKGGWMSWLSSIILTIAETLSGHAGGALGMLFGAGFSLLNKFISGNVEPTLEKRVEDYFVSEGYSAEEAKKIAKNISKF